MNDIQQSNRESLIDKKFESDSTGNFSNKLFLRVVAKGKTFKSVDFKYTIFDNCYFRSCFFDSCNFTGCKFSGSNFYGSSFSGCAFDFAIFERTILDHDILIEGAPVVENLKLKFARSLRTNFQSLGDSAAVNKAIGIELEATEIHLRKAWKSTDTYYRKKYKKWGRFVKFLEWANFKFLDFVWGNGENILKLFRFIVLILILMTLYDVVNFRNPILITDYFKSLIEMPSVFMGVFQPEQYPKWFLSLVVFIRLISFGLFISIIVKRFNRR